MNAAGQARVLQMKLERYAEDIKRAAICMPVFVQEGNMAELINQAAYIRQQALDLKTTTVTSIPTIIKAFAEQSHMNNSLKKDIRELMDKKKDSPNLKNAPPPQDQLNGSTFKPPQDQPKGLSTPTSKDQEMAEQQEEVSDHDLSLISIDEVDEAPLTSTPSK